MASDLWHRMKPILHAALELDASARTAYLENACERDPELKRQIERLIAAEEQPTGTLAPSTGASTMPFLVKEDQPSHSGRFIPGQVLLGRFRIMRLLGRGGMGEVYEAEDLQLGRIALKTIRLKNGSAPEMFDRFRQEVQVARKVSGSQVCRIHELFLLPSEPPTAFLTMELIEGVTLSSKLRRHGPMPVREALHIALELCEGLRLIHERGIVHSDFKSANIMLAEENSRQRVVLMDFGLAHEAGLHRESIAGSTNGTASAGSGSGSITGTPDYMAPEQFEGKPVSPATDIYALGIVLYELVTGVHPYSAESTLAAALHRARKPKPPSSLQRHLPRQWDRVIERCLEYDAKQRFQSAAEVRKALQPNPLDLRLLLRDQPWLLYPVAATLLAFAAWGGAAWWHARQLYHPSAEALRWYSDGVAALHDGTFIKATRMFDSALAVDPHFLMAHVRLAEAWADLDFEGAAQRELLTATPKERRRLGSLDLLYCDAVQALVTNDFAAAIASYQTLLDKLPPGDKAAGYADLGWAYERSGETVHALENYEKASALDPRNVASALRIGVLESRRNHLSASDEAFGRAEKIFTAELNQEGLAELDYERGYAANQAEQDDKAAQLLNRALDEATRIPDVQLEIRALTQLSSLSYSTTEAEHALDYATRAIRLARDSQLESWAADALARLAQAYIRLGELPEAQEAVQESLMVARQNPQPRVEALANFTLASLMNQMDRPADVIAPAKAALDYARRVGNKNTEVGAGLLLTRAERDQGNLPGALEAGQNLIAVSRQMGIPQLIAQSEETVGSVLMIQNEYPQALTHFHDALSSAPSADLQAFESAHCAAALWRLGRYAQSEDLIRGLKGSDGLMSGIAQNRIDALISQGKYAAASAMADKALHDYADALPIKRDEIELADAVAEAHAGARERASSAVARALGREQTGLDREEIAYRNVLLSNAQLALGEAEPAREHALQALAFFSPAGARDSAFHAAALAAVASKQLKDEAGYAKYSGISFDILSALQHTWSPEDFQSYRARPDVVALSALLLPASSGPRR
jgi:tetratricopeptide (TPR) repeat protein